MLVVGMVLEHLLSPIQEQKLRMEARGLHQENARLKLSLEKARKKVLQWEQESRELREQDQLKDDLIKELNEKIEKLELTQKTYAGMIFKSAAKHAAQTTLSGNKLKRGGKYCLVPGNPKYKTIYPRDELTIDGVVISVIRTYYK